MPTTDEPIGTTSSRTLTYAAYVSFVPIGIATVLLGSMLPILSARWSFNYSQSGALFDAQYFASTCSVALSGVLAARWGFRFPMKVGLVLMALGLAFLLSGSKALGILCIAAYGGGLGLAVPAANLLVAAANPGRRSAALNFLNFFWSAGAVACSPLVSASAKSQHIPVFLACVSGFSMLIAAGIALMPAGIKEPAASREDVPVLPLIREKRQAFLILAVLFFLYVGVENGFGQWIASYSKGLGTLTLAIALATPTFFYASLTLGRWLSPALLRILDEIRLVRAGLLLALAGIAGLMLSRYLVGIVLSACIAGLGLSCVYPITIALLAHEFGPGSTKLGSVMFVLSNIGGGLLPWFVGVASNRAGTIRTGLAIPLVGCAALFGLFLRNWSTSGSAQRAPNAEPA